MELIDKAHILSDFFDEYEASTSQSIVDFISTHDLSFYYATGLSYGDILALSQNGEGYIHKAWQDLLDMYGLEDRYYVDLYDLAHAARIATDNLLPNPDVIY